MMGIVGTDYRFLWASAGLPGSVNDACSFQLSLLYQGIASGQKLPVINKIIRETAIPPIILGDSAFPHHTWLQKPYTNANLTEKQSYFNYRLSRARMVTECAFGQLKSRWRVLYRKSEVSQDSLKLAVLACIVLHNLCIEKGDSVSKKLDLTYDPVSKKQNSIEEIRAILKMVSGTCIQESSRVQNQFAM